MTTRRTDENPSFTAARPLVGQMRSVIRKALRTCPDMEPEDGAHSLFLAFVNEGLIEEAPWGEDLVYSLMVAEIDEMWACAEVV